MLRFIRLILNVRVDFTLGFDDARSVWKATVDAHFDAFSVRYFVKFESFWIIFID